MSPEGSVPHTGFRPWTCAAGETGPAIDSPPTPPVSAFSGVRRIVDSAPFVQLLSHPSDDGVRLYALDAVGGVWIRRGTWWESISVERRS